MTISYTLPSAHLAPATLAFGTQAQGTISAPKTVTITNAGGSPLTLSGLTFTGADPGDFLVGSDGCLGEIEPGESCGLTVNFVPQANGTRAATLRIASNDPSGPATVTLEGTGGSLPQGPTGSPGAQGAAGSQGLNGLQGAAGPRGPAGQVELVTCEPVTKAIARHGRRRKVRARKCATMLVSGTVSFTAAATRAEISRGGVVYARGAALDAARLHERLVLTPLRRLARGRYTLVLQRRHGERWHRSSRPIMIG